MGCDKESGMDYGFITQRGKLFGMKLMHSVAVIIDSNGSFKNFEHWTFRCEECGLGLGLLVLPKIGPTQDIWEVPLMTFRNRSCKMHRMEWVLG